MTRIMVAPFFDIRDPERLERILGRTVPLEDRPRLASVMDAFPVRLTSHLLDLVQASPEVARQFLPDPREGTSRIGEARCFVGLVPTGVVGVERMYTDRCIIMPQPSCPAYCRFCFRKDHALRHRPPLSRCDLDAALAYVGRHPELQEILITGGEPVLDPERLHYLLAGLRRIAHVGPIRVACRALVSAPDLVGERVTALLARHQDLAGGRPVEVGLHINHPDEMSRATALTLARMREAGIVVYSQTVLLRGINTDAAVLQELMRLVRVHGAQPYALFFPEPVLGTDHLRPTLAQAQELKAALRRLTSGRSNPHLIVTTRVGKVELDVDAEVVEREADGRHLWIQTPYTLDGLLRLAAGFRLPPTARLDGQGRIIVRYMDGPAP